MDYTNQRFMDSQGQPRDPVARAADLMGLMPKTNEGELLPGDAFIERMRGNPSPKPRVSPRDAVIQIIRPQ